MNDNFLPSPIVTEARTLLGVRFRHQGRNAELGVDCLGLIIYVAKRLHLRCKNGTLLFQHDNRSYSKIPDGALLLEHLTRYLVIKPVLEMREGDIALIHYDKNPQHLAIITHYNNSIPLQHGLIHAFAPARKVVEHHLDDSWKQKITHIFSIEN
jgi:cell wall-associated NlpC family hydrolase